MAAERNTRGADQDGSRSGLDTASEVRGPAAAVPRAPGQAWVEERTRVAVGRNVNVSGKLIFSEPVRIEGSFRGEVSSADLVVISGEGCLEGSVKTPRLLILGELRGDALGSRHVVLGPHARVYGRIHTESLTICEGAYFEGYVKMAGARSVDSGAHAASPAR